MSKELAEGENSSEKEEEGSSIFADEVDRFDWAWRQRLFGAECQSVDVDRIADGGVHLLGCGQVNCCCCFPSAPSEFGRSSCSGFSVGGRDGRNLFYRYDQESPLCGEGGRGGDGNADESGRKLSELNK